MVLKYYIDEDQQLIYSEYSGNITYPMLRKALPQLWDKVKNIRELKSYINLTQAQFHISFDETRELIDFLMESLNGVRYPRGILVEQSVDTALSMLIAHKTRAFMKIEVFSTQRGICNFLKIEPEMIESIQQKAFKEIHA